MEALSRVKELFPNLAGISSGEIAALFERFDERTRDDAARRLRGPAGWLVGCRLARPALHRGGGRGGVDEHVGLGRSCCLLGPVQQLMPPFFLNHV